MSRNVFKPLPNYFSQSEKKTWSRDEGKNLAKGTRGSRGEVQAIRNFKFLGA